VLLLLLLLLEKRAAKASARKQTRARNSVYATAAAGKRDSLLPVSAGQ
jgi:hypothetical protein